MKKMKNSMRLIGLSLALLLLFTAGACDKSQAEGKDTMNSEEFETTNEIIEAPFEGYTLSLEKNDLILRHDDSIISKGNVTRLTISPSTFSSTLYPVLEKETIEWFLSNILVRERVQLTPTTWESLGCTPEKPISLYYTSVSFNPEIDLNIWLRSEGQIILYNHATDKLYVSSPGVINSDLYYQFLHDYDWPLK